MPEIKFPSKFLKANVNVEEGDCIKFVDVGAQDDKGQWIFTVAIIPKDVGVATETKKFQMNKKNFKAVSALYGTNSDNWKGKEMQVHIGTANNPQTGEEVPSIQLKAVGGADPEDVREFNER
jgi:hypothetical protein